MSDLIAAIATGSTATAIGIVRVSGPGCCSAVLCGHILPRLERGSYRRVLFIATGALMSQTTFLQKESIPAIAHLVELRGPECSARG